jgi:hypothetical protein
MQSETIKSLNKSLELLRQLPEGIMSDKVVTLATDLVRTLQSLHVEHALEIREMQERDRQLERRRIKLKKKRLDRIKTRSVICDAWLVFASMIVMHAQKEHDEDHFHHSYAGWRYHDTGERLKQILEFLTGNWNYPYPPFGLLKFPDGAFKKFKGSSSKVDELPLGYSDEILLQKGPVNFHSYLADRANFLEDLYWCPGSWHEMVEPLGDVDFQVASIKRCISGCYGNITFAELMTKKWFTLPYLGSHWFVDLRCEGKCCKAPDELRDELRCMISRCKQGYFNEDDSDIDDYDDDDDDDDDDDEDDDDD